MSIQAIRVEERVFEVLGHRFRASELIICDKAPCPDPCRVILEGGRECMTGRTFDCGIFACVCDNNHVSAAVVDVYSHEIVDLDWDEAYFQEMLDRIARLRAAAAAAQIAVERATATQVKQLLQLIGL